LVYVPANLASVPVLDGVAITGQIKKPGRYSLPAEGPMSIVDLVGRAGGFTDIAKSEDVTIARRAEQSREKTIIHVDVRAIIQRTGELRADDPSLMLHAGDLVYVPER